MKRRNFLTAAGVGAAASTLAAPAIAQGQPEVRWRLASSFPKSLDTLFGTAEFLCQRVAALTDGKFQIRAFAAGEIVPPLAVADAVRDATIEMGHTASYYYVGKDPTFAFDTALPFGLNTRQQISWMYHGGGLELFRDFLKEHNIISFPAGQTGAQMGGWFRKEINSVEDLKGLKFRIGGFAGQIFARVGAVPQQLAAPDIYPALEKGTVDAAEWVGPYDDEKLGFNKVARFYYSPGFWEGCAQLSAYVNIRAWEGLPATYKAALESASAEANLWMMAKYDAVNAAALRRLVAGGTQVRQFPRPVMEACHKAAFEIYAETAAKNDKFRRIYEPWLRFREDEQEWFRVAEYSFDDFMIRQRIAEQQRQRQPQQPQQQQQRRG